MYSLSLAGGTVYGKGGFGSLVNGQVNSLGVGRTASGTTGSISLSADGGVTTNTINGGGGGLFGIVCNQGTFEISVNGASSAIRFNSSSQFGPQTDGAISCGGGRVNGFNWSQLAAMRFVSVIQSYAVAGVANVNINCALGDVNIVTCNNAASNPTVTSPTNPVEGQRLIVVLKNTTGGAIAGSSWNAVFKFAAGAAPASPATATNTKVEFIYDGTNFTELNRVTGVAN